MFRSEANKSEMSYASQLCNGAHCAAEGHAIRNKKDLNGSVAM